MAGSSLSPTPPLLTQELLEPVGGEGESLAAQLHQVGILQPRVGQAVLQGGPAPARPVRDREPGKTLLERAGCALPQAPLPILIHEYVCVTGQRMGSVSRSLE